MASIFGKGYGVERLVDRFLADLLTFFFLHLSWMFSHCASVIDTPALGDDCV